jgi:hypothetical protein
MGKLVYNVACMPTEEKYKSVKASNARISSLIIDTPGALAVMETLGWVHEDEKLICGAPQTMSQVPYFC